MKEQEKISEKDINETEISNLPEKGSKYDHKYAHQNRRKMDKHSVSFQHRENIRSSNISNKVREYNNPTAKYTSGGSTAD